MASLRMEAAGYTTSGRNSTGKSSAKERASGSAKKTAPRAKAKAAVKASPKAKAKANPKAALFPDTMKVPGELGAQGNRFIYDKDRIPKGSPAKKAVPATGRDRFGPGKKSTKGNGSFARPSLPMISRQENEAKIMSDMRLRRMGPGQR